MLAVLVRFRLMVRSMRSHYRRVEHICGLSGAYVWAMTEVAAAPGTNVSDLARRLAVHQSTASNMVEKLETSGLLERHRASNDQRVVRLHLTAKGRRALARAPAPLRGALQEGLMRLPMTALVRLRRDLDLLLRHMHAGHEGGQQLLLAELVGGEDGQVATAAKARRAARRRAHAS
ncbi:MAG TPA: MarR family transcriptional regulator [Casimicrobiaceae bacterium]|nr:MarR family transcriptional regulator [Casimicrobiaceae bacterium]